MPSTLKKKYIFGFSLIIYFNVIFTLSRTIMTNYDLDHYYR